MNKAKPILDSATHYRIEVQGQVNAGWLQNFDNSPEINLDETAQTEGLTVLNVFTDQSGMVGLMRRLHGLGMTILRFQIVSDERKAPGVEVQP